MYPGLSHDEIIEECIKELNHYFEVGPEVALISAEKGVQCVPFDESPQKKFPYFEGTYEVFDVPHTDFQIRYQPEQILAANVTEDASQRSEHMIRTRIQAQSK